MAQPLTVNQAPELPQQAPASHELKLLTHRLSAGFPSPAADYAEDEIDLNHYLVQHKSATYLFTVKGDSMIGANIVEGDKVVVDCSLRPRHNDIVVAVVDGEYTIKRLYKYRGRIELRPENPAYQPIQFQEGSQLEVWAVVVGVVRRFAPRS